MLKKGLGRGLGSLIPSRSDAVKTVTRPRKSIRAAIGQTISENAVVHLSTSQIVPNPHQPRTQFTELKDRELQDSIKEHGLLQPVTVCPIEGEGQDSYQLIAGERRLRAVQALRMPTIPAIIRKASELEKLELALIENIQRQDLNPIEEATAYRKLLDEFGLTQDQTAKKIGKSRSQVANLLRFLHLPTEIQKSLSEGLITEGHAKIILGLRTPEEQMKFYYKVIKQKMSVRDTEVEIRKVKVSSFTRNMVVDPVTLAQQENLQKALGTKVKIERRGSKGKIVIEFYSDEELASIIQSMTH